MSTLSASGTGVSATFFGRLAAAEALAELARADAAVRGTLCGIVVGTAATAAAAPPAVKTGSRRHRDTSSSNGKHAPRATAGRHGSAGSDEAPATTAREVVMSTVAERSNSGWAWERELAFLLMGACYGGSGDREGEEGGSTDGNEMEAVRDSLRWVPAGGFK